MPGNVTSTIDCGLSANVDVLLLFYHLLNTNELANCIVIFDKTGTILNLLDTILNSIFCLLKLLNFEQIQKNCNKRKPSIWKIQKNAFKIRTVFVKGRERKCAKTLDRFWVCGDWGIIEYISSFSHKIQVFIVQTKLSLECYSIYHLYLR